MAEDFGFPAGFPHNRQQRRRPTLTALKRWGQIWVVGFVLWIILAFLSAAGSHVYIASIRGPETWAQLLAWEITVAFIWSLLTPPIYALSRHFTFDRSNWQRMLPLHLGFSVAMTFLASCVVVWLEPFITWTPEAHLPFFADVLSHALMDFQ